MKKYFGVELGLKRKRRVWFRDIVYVYKNLKEKVKIKKVVVYCKSILGS